MSVWSRSDFPALEKSVYLDSAYMGPTPLTVAQAGMDFIARRRDGTAGRVEDWMAEAGRVREALARRIGAEPHEIALLPNTTAGANIVATGLQWRPGDNVVWDDLEYPSNRLVWLGLQETHGVENRIVRSHDGAVHPADLARAVDRNTRMVCVSLVAHANGFLHDARAIADLAHAHGAHLFVDASQALGALPVDVRQSGIDLLSCGTYKWLLGPLGLAFLYVRGALLDEIVPSWRGWMQVQEWGGAVSAPVRAWHDGARKFETATLYFQGVYELAAALQYLERVGAEEIESRVLSLSGRLWRGLQQLGIQLRTPPGTQSGIVTLADTGGALARHLDAHGIVGTARESEIRVSPHFFNTEAEVDLVLGVLEEARGSI